ncbi:MAG: LamB/YcsF family protein, partial [Candidatus Eremiobacteraeota bacterium]|nr:LamB/YcsF family protein [Candidatus Eremiobacteraeota bacterium]
AAEAFCDRVYEVDGTLRNRSHPDAVIEDPERAAKQAVDIVVHGHVRAVNGVAIGVHAQSLCVHGDSKNAVETAAAIRAALKRSGADVVPLATIV